MVQTSHLFEGQSGSKLPHSKGAQCRQAAQMHKLQGRLLQSRPGNSQFRIYSAAPVGPRILFFQPRYVKLSRCRRSPVRMFDPEMFAITSILPLPQYLAQQIPPLAKQFHSLPLRIRDSREQNKVGTVESRISNLEFIHTPSTDTPLRTAPGLCGG